MKILPFATPSDLEAALPAVRRVLASGGVLAVPTETFYGLAADPASERALAKLLRMKGRPPEMGVPVLAADLDQVEQLAEIPAAWRERLEAVWPAPLTVVLPARVPLAAARRSTLAVRVPDHALLRALLAATGPLTGTSANRHGQPPAVTAAAAAELAEPPDLVLDGGPTPGGPGSTIVDLTGGEPARLREGPIAFP
jgi:Sua5/YciO/YrdC/YwlC family protein